MSKDELIEYLTSHGFTANGNEYTDFDFKTAFKSGTTEWDTQSAAYKGIIADIDHDAEYFL